MIPTPHIIESALLLLAAFVLGCVIGHVLRRMFPRVPQAVIIQSAPATNTAPPVSVADPAAAEMPEIPSAKAANIVAKSARPRKTPPIPAPERDLPAIASAEVENRDDLKKINGIGPKLEALLHQDGVLSYAQIAAWKRKDISEIDARLNLRGRIERDDWITQAKLLAKAR